jgi:Ca2+-binding EF-hand superfamily protein
VTPTQVLVFLEERDYSIVAQPFYRFFEVIDKVYHDKCTFEEFLPAVISFALFTRSEVLGFVFSMIDEDKDELISKADIFK